MTQSQYETLDQNKSHAIIDYVYAMIQNAEDAKDIAQDAFAAIWENVGNIDPEGATAYLYATAYTKTIDHTRKNRPLETQDQPEPIEADYSDLHSSLAKLKPKQSAAIYLSFWKKLSYTEIAQEMNCTEKEVDNLLFRAKAKLREMMRHGN